MASLELSVRPSSPAVLLSGPGMPRWSAETQDLKVQVRVLTPLFNRPSATNSSWTLGECLPLAGPWSPIVKWRRGTSDPRVPFQHGILWFPGGLDFRQSLRIRLLGLNPDLGAVWPWAGYPSPLMLRFSICKTKRRLTATRSGCRED